MQIKEIKSIKEERQFTVKALINKLTSTRTKRGDENVIVTLEDTTGTIEARSFSSHL